VYRLDGHDAKFTRLLGGSNDKKEGKSFEKKIEE